MATTIITKFGSGAPAASDVVRGELAVDTENKRLYTENSGGSVVELGTNPAANVTFGDNIKAIFGAGSDLQIFHDGSNSFINDAGTGDLTIKASNNLYLMSGSSELYAKFTTDGAATLYHDNSAKLTTTSTGIDVTGTITADGLDLGDASVLNVGTIALDTIKGDADDNTNITFAGSDTTTFTQGGTQRLAVNTLGINVTGTVTADGLTVDGSGTAVFSGGQYIQVDGDGASATDLEPVLWARSQVGASITQMNVQGDQWQFGGGGTLDTTPTMTIDYGSNAVGIGTSSPGRLLEVNTNGEAFIRIRSSDSGNAGLEFGDQSDSVQGAIFMNASDNSLRFNGFDNAERMRINSSGNVGIGTTSPATTLHVSSATTTKSVVETTGTSSDALIEFTKGQGSGNTWSMGLDHSNSSAFSLAYLSNGSPSLTTHGVLTVDTTGNVGIGTSSPNVSSYDANASALTISGTNRGLLELRGATGANSTQLGAIRFLSGSTSEADIICELDSSGDGLLTFDTNGSERLRIDSSGNLLVGTTETDIGFTDSGAGFSVSPLGVVQVARSSANELLYLNKLDNDGDIIRFSKDGAEVGTIATTSSRLSIGSNDVGLFFDSTNERFTPIDQANQTDRDGAISLGYASSRFKDLFLSGDLALGASNGFVFGNTNGVNIRAASGKSTIFDTAGSERMRIDSSGNVTIGTPPNNDADAQLHVYGENQATANLTDAGVSGATIRLSDNQSVAGSGGAVVFTNNQGDVANSAGFAAIKGLLVNGSGNTVGDLAFSTRNGTTATALTERMRITSGGNLLVGRTSAGNTGLGHSIRSGDSAIFSRDATGETVQIGRNANAGDLVRFYANGTEKGSIDFDGSNTISYTSSSDQRLKENIVDAPSASDDIDAIQVRSFDWISDGAHQKYGMVAQELVTVAPSAVSQPEDPEEMMGVDYSKLVPMLIKEVQQLRARVAQLEGEN